MENENSSHIDLYTWATPNGRKVSIILEELGLPYKVWPIDIMAGDQHQPEFVRFSPNNKIPAIIDHETEIGDFVHIGPSVTIGGQAIVGDLSWIGIGANILNNVNLYKSFVNNKTQKSNHHKSYFL